MSLLLPFPRTAATAGPRYPAVIFNTCGRRLLARPLARLRPGSGRIFAAHTTTTIIIREKFSGVSIGARPGIPGRILSAGQRARQIPRGPAPDRPPLLNVPAPSWSRYPFDRSRRNVAAVAARESRLPAYPFRQCFISTRYSGGGGCFFFYFIFLYP